MAKLILITVVVAWASFPVFVWSKAAVESDAFLCVGKSGTVLDTINGQPSVETDFGEFFWSISNSELSFSMDMPNLIQPILVNRVGLESGFLEYEWGALIDVDNNSYTGSPENSLGEGADYKLSISYFHSFGKQNALNLNQMQWDLWEYSEPEHGWISISSPHLVAVPSEDSFQLTETVPGLNLKSKLMPFTFYAEPFTGFLRPDTFEDCRLDNTDRVFQNSFGD